MEPMKPMEPMRPLKGVEPWWPKHLGEPLSSGSQDGSRYAFFADKRRLLIEKDGTCSTYDSGSHRITDISQSGSSERVVFDGPDGSVSLEELTRLG